MVGEMLRIYHPDGTYPTKIMKVGRTKGVVIESRKYRKRYDHSHITESLMFLGRSLIIKKNPAPGSSF